MIVGRVAVGQVAAHRGHLAHNGVGDQVRGVGQQWVARLHQAGARLDGILLQRQVSGGLEGASVDSVTRTPGGAFRPA